MSGSALSPWSIAKDADYHLESMAKSVNCDPSNLNSFELITCLRSKTVDELIKAEEQLNDSDGNGHSDIFKSSFGPIIDGLLIVSDPISLMESFNLANDSNVGNNKQLIPQNNLLQSSFATASNKKSASPHSLLAGVTRSEYPFIFTQSEEDSGLDNDHDAKDNKSESILYNLITSIVDFYQEVRNT